MPEGPEVWILAQAVRQVPSYESVFSHNKQLVLPHLNQVWSFGLTGTVALEEGRLIKRNSGFLPGSICEGEFNEPTTSVAWMTASREELQEMVHRRFETSRKALGALLLDQNLIGGIGVAWGSELLFRLKLRPEVSAKRQNLEELALQLVQLRSEVQELYQTVLAQGPAQAFTNGWYHNLYASREPLLQVYKKGEPIQVYGRTWWV